MNCDEILPVVMGCSQPLWDAHSCNDCFQPLGMFPTITGWMFPNAIGPAHPSSTLRGAAGQAQGAVDSCQLLPQALHLPLCSLGTLQETRKCIRMGTPMPGAEPNPSTMPAFPEYPAPIYYWKFSAYLVGFFKVGHDHGHFVCPERRSKRHQVVHICQSRGKGHKVSGWQKSL